MVTYLVYVRHGSEVRVRRIDAPDENVGDKVLELLDHQEVTMHDAMVINDCRVVCIATKDRIVEVWEDSTKCDLDNEIKQHNEVLGFKYVKEEI